MEYYRSSTIIYFSHTVKHFSLHKWFVTIGNGISMKSRNQLKTREHRSSLVFPVVKRIRHSNASEFQWCRKNMSKTNERHDGIPHYIQHDVKISQPFCLLLDGCQTKQLKAIPSHNVLAYILAHFRLHTVWWDQSCFVCSYIRFHRPLPMFTRIERIDP